MTAMQRDVVIVGAGLGGLTTAALLGASGLQVTIVDQNETAGGCASHFVRDGMDFDPAIHFTLDAGPGGYFETLLEYLGVSEMVEFRQFERTYRAVFPGLTIEAPTGRAAFLAAHQELFPESAEDLAQLFDLRKRLFEQLASLPQRLGSEQMGNFANDYPEIVRFRNATTDEVFAEFLGEGHASTAMSAIWPFVGSPPKRMSFLLFNQMLEAMHAGVYGVRGGFYQVIRALCAAVEANGGEILLGERVQQILCSEGKADGVRLANGEVLRSQVVITNSDLRETYRGLLGAESSPTGLDRKLDRFKLAPAAMTIVGYLSCTPASIGLDEETLVFPSWDPSDDWKRIEAEEGGGTWVSCASAAFEKDWTGGRHPCVVTALTKAVADNNWWERREVFVDRVLTDIAERVPGFSEQFNLLDVATPDTWSKFTSASGGAAYGWENTPAQTASKRFSHQSPSVQGLYHVGHWVEEGTSSLRVVTGGRATAALVQQDLGLGQHVPDFGGPSFLERGNLK